MKKVTVCVTVLALSASAALGAEADPGQVLAFFVHVLLVIRLRPIAT
jgi:hypothetical protein